MRVSLEFNEALEGGPGIPTMRATVTPDDGPTVEIELSGGPGGVSDWDGEITAVTVREEEGVISRDLRVPLRQYLDLLGERYGLGRYRVEPPDRRRGRAHPDAFLRKVAAAYRASGNSITGLTPDLDGAFDASDSTKYRWVRAARGRGLLEPRAE